MQFKIKYTDPTSTDIKFEDVLGAKDEDALKKDFSLYYPGYQILSITPLDDEANQNKEPIQIEEKTISYIDKNENDDIKTSIIELSNGIKVKFDKSTGIMYELAWKPISYTDFTKTHEIRILKKGKDISQLPKDFELLQAVWLPCKNS